MHKAFEDETQQVRELEQVIKPLLRGRPAAVQGALLADLLALWLAGHVVPGDPKQTREVRERLLEHHLEAMWWLVDVNYHEQIEPQLRERGTS